MYIYIYIGIKFHVVKFFVVFVSKREIFYTENTDFCDIHTWPTHMHTLAPIHIHIHIHIHTWPTHIHTWVQASTRTTHRPTIRVT